MPKTPAAADLANATTTTKAKEARDLSRFLTSETVASVRPSPSRGRLRNDNEDDRDRDPPRQSMATVGDGAIASVNTAQQQQRQSQRRQQQQTNRNKPPGMPTSTSMPGIGIGTPLLVLFGLNGASLSFPALALSYVANDRARIPVDLLSVYGAVSFLPWSFKPCYAYLDARWRRSWSGGGRGRGCCRSSRGAWRSRQSGRHRRRRMVCLCPNDDDGRGRCDDDEGEGGGGGGGGAGGRHVLLASLLAASGIATGLTILVPIDGVATCVALGALRGLCFAFPEFLLGLNLLDGARREWERARAVASSPSSSSAPSSWGEGVATYGQELRATSSPSPPSSNSTSHALSQPSFEAIAGTYQARAAGARNVGSLLASALLLALLASRWLFLGDGDGDGDGDDHLMAMDDAFVDAVLLAAAAMPVAGALVALMYRVGGTGDTPALLPEKRPSRSSTEEADDGEEEEEGAWIGMKDRLSSRPPAERTFLLGKRLAGGEEKDEDEDEAAWIGHFPESESHGFPRARNDEARGKRLTGLPPNGGMSLRPPHRPLEVASPCSSRGLFEDFYGSDHDNDDAGCCIRTKSSPLLPLSTASPSSPSASHSHPSSPRPSLLSRTEMTALATFQVVLLWVGLRQPLSAGPLRPVGWVVILAFLLGILLLLSSSLARLPFSVVAIHLRRLVGRRGATAKSRGRERGGVKEAPEKTRPTLTKMTTKSGGSGGGASPPPPQPPLSRSVALFLVLKHSAPQPSYQWSSYTYHLLRTTPLYLQVLSLVNSASSALASAAYGRFVAPRCRHRCDLLSTLGWTTAASALASLSYLVVIGYNNNNGHDNGGEQYRPGKMELWNFLLAIPVGLVSTFFYELQFLPSVVLATSSAILDDAPESTMISAYVDAQTSSSSAPLIDEDDDEAMVVASDNGFASRLPEQEDAVVLDASDVRASFSLPPQLPSGRRGQSEALPAAAAATAPGSSAYIPSGSRRFFRRANTTAGGGTGIDKNEGDKNVGSTEAGTEAAGLRYGTYVSCIDLGDQVGAWLTVPIVSAFGVTRGDWSRVSDLVLVCSACSFVSVLFLVLLLPSHAWCWPRPWPRRR